MAYTEQQLEAMVRQVLERLSALQPAPQIAPAPAKTTTNATQLNASGNQILNARVIGTRELEAVKSVTKRVIVQRGTVVTPAARDMLREKKIELAWATNAAPAKQHTGGNTTATAAKPATRQVVLGQAAAMYDATALVRQIEARGYSVQRLAHAGLEQVARELAIAAAFDGSPAVLLTDQPWAAVIAANRHPAARAAWVRDRRDAIAAQREVNLNLAIVNVPGQSAFGIWNTILPFLERQ